MSRRDAAVAIAFVVAALADAAARDLASPAHLAFESGGALTLLSLAVRRQRPLVALGVISAAAVLGTIASQLLWTQSDDAAGVWIFALMLASYSLGVHGRDRTMALGALLPLLVVLSADLVGRSGWPRISGILFVTVFVGVLPTAAGRLVRLRNERLRILGYQRARIIEAQRLGQHSAVLAERLRTMKRLSPTLVEGLRTVAALAESRAVPEEVEGAARRLLVRTREEVVALTAPVHTPRADEVPVVDHLTTLRAAAQPWVVAAAGAVGAGLCVESTQVLTPAASWWAASTGGLAVVVPLALAWWRPVEAVALAWVGAAAYSRLVTPLDGSLSEVTFAFMTAFVVAALSTRTAAVAGLVVCLLGQLVGVGTGDPLGEAMVLVVCWLAGRALHETGQLVERSRANNDALAAQHESLAESAVIEERLRLAREIHDAIGHSLTVVALQAGAARRLAKTDPRRADEVMRTVAEVARDGIAALVPDDEGAALETLVERLRVTGMPIDADLAGEALLDSAQRVVALRVVQEALTNVLRHAPGSRASVAVRGRGDVVEVAVSNSAPTGPGAGAGTGRGLTGLRERVTGASGCLTWGSRRDGGFVVRALLPTAALVETTSP